MANRVVYGLSYSENGWPMVDQDSCTWVDIPGTSPTVKVQIQNGQPLATLRAFAADWNAFIEPLRDEDTACWTPTNSVASSNHLSGTALDCNWNSHPFQVSYAGFNQTQIATMREMLAFYEDTVFWGQDWTSPKDPMHANMGYNSFNSPHTADFIARKIRADGFSTFRRGNAPQAGDPALILSQATGLTLNRATEILPTMVDGLEAAECTNSNRSAMFIAQTGHESANFDATEEYASGAAYEGRTDLGNTQPGDGVRFKGRTWIQITGRFNYGKFSQWAFGKGLVPTPTYFVDNPTELSDLKWAGIGAAWYWTVARADINELSDNRDIVAVTQRINGGQNGIDDRRNRYNRALAMGDQLLTLLTGEDDFLPELTGPEQRELLNLMRWAFAPDNGEFRKLVASRSMYRTSNVREDTLFGRVMNEHAFGWDGRVESSAYRGEAWAIELLAQAVAGTLAGVIRPDGTPDQFLVDHARAILGDLETNYPSVLQNYLALKGARQ